MKKLLPCLMSITFLLMTSCDPDVTYSKIIQNDSEFDIAISVIGGRTFEYPIDSFHIKKQSEETIMEYRGLGRVSDYEDCSIYADSLLSQIINSDSLTLNVDLNNQSNWTYSIIDKFFGGGGSCECRIILKNEHIE